MERVKDIAELLINYCWQSPNENTLGGFFYYLDEKGKGNEIYSFFQGNLSNFLVGAYRHLGEKKYLEFAKQSWEVMNNYISKSKWDDNKGSTQFIQGGYAYPYFYKKK